MKIAVAEPSVIIRSGLLSVLGRLTTLNIQILEIAEIAQLGSALCRQKPDMLIVNPALQKDFRYMIKHNGGMIAKGRLGGVMFLAALEHDDYFAWARHANEMADIIRAGMERAGIPFFQRTTTNQIFAVLTEEQNAALALDFAYERWATLDDGRVAVRFVTSWATTAEDCRKLVSALEAMA